ncbi:MAG TPA: circularly permuted type 2 ATP-grasp protein, partial [Candidatus Didemnitutus sp.]|nr:circularly permuted type 2 ATP-grasp protein [Candidatus Didemnitutus sp.]
SLANLLGARALETPALLAFLQPLCRQLLGEELRLPNAATWWCGQDAPRDYVLEHMTDLVLKPAFRTADATPPRYGSWMGKAGRAALAERIRAEPWAWCGQERVFQGTTPGWHNGALRPMPFITRVYLAWHDGDYIVMPGGLTRCNPDGQDMIVSLQRGSISKDTWVLHEGPPEAPVTSIPSRPGESLRHPAATPSRMANNLFWLGRYLERSSQLARKFEKIDALLYDEIALLEPGVPADVMALVFRAQDMTSPPRALLLEQAAFARDAAEDPALPGSLAANLGHLLRLLEQLKATLPHEGWPLLRQLRQRHVSADGPACTWLLQQLSALESLTNDAMPRDTAWHFLDLGRRIERGQQLITLLRTLLYPGEAVAPTEFRLQSVLHLADSLFTYRGLYQGQIDTAGTLDWLLIAAENPRGFRFQAEKINQHLGVLPAELAPEAVDALRALAFRLHSDVRLAEAGPLAIDATQAAALLRELQGGLGELSLKLTEIYFAHTASR